MSRRPVRTWVAALGVFVFALCASPARGGHYTWTSHGPESGAIFRIVVNPLDPGTIYVLDSYYGYYLFRTVDAGQNWQFVETPTGGVVNQLVMDPAHPDHLYIPSSSGVAKSVDGGRTWFSASQGLPGYAAALALTPSAPSTLYAAAGSGLFRSDDAGGHWTQVVGNFPSASYLRLSADPFDASTLYLLADLAPFSKSTDGGITWNPAGTGLPPNPEKIFPDPRVPGRIYVTASGAGPWVSSDRGDTFVPSNGGIEGHSLGDLAFDATDPNRMYSASYGVSSEPPISGGVFVSSDAGASWFPIDVGISGLHYSSAVAVAPSDSSRLYTGAGNSILRGHFLASDDQGSSWTDAEKGLSGFTSYGALPDPSQASSAFGLSGTSFFRTSDSGASWTLLSSVDFWLAGVASDPTSPSTVYTTYASYDETSTLRNGVYKSIDGGLSWSDSSIGLPTLTWMHDILVAPSDPQVLFVSTDLGFYGSSNAAGSWNHVLDGFGRAIAIDPQDPRILYAGFAANSGLGDFQRSDDGGATWSAPSGTPTHWAGDVAIAPSDASTVYVLFPSNHVYKSTDRGLSFVDASQGLPQLQDGELGHLAIDRSDPATIYAAGGLGGAVYRTASAAASWEPLPGFLPTLTNLDLSVSANGRTLYASGVSGIFVFDRSFLDVPDPDPFWSAIDAAAMNGLSVGCGLGNFCAASANTRAQISVFLLRAKNGPAFAPPAATGAVFGDVSASSFAAAWIEELSREGITSGCGGGDYCPSADLSRAEMAVMVLKALHGQTFAPPPATGAIFGDVAADAFAAAWIEELYAEGVSAGCGGGNFCPGASLTRGQAAALLTRAFQLS